MLCENVDTIKCLMRMCERTILGEKHPSMWKCLQTKGKICYCAAGCISFAANIKLFRVPKRIVYSKDRHGHLIILT